MQRQKNNRKRGLGEGNERGETDREEKNEGKGERKEFSHPG